MNIQQLKELVKEVAAKNGYVGGTVYAKVECSEYRHTKGKDTYEVMVGVFTTDMGNIVSASSTHYEIALKMLDLKLQEKQLIDANTTPNTIEL